MRPGFSLKDDLNAFLRPGYNPHKKRGCLARHGEHHGHGTYFCWWCLRKFTSKSEWQAHLKKQP